MQLACDLSTEGMTSKLVAVPEGRGWQWLLPLARARAAFQPLGFSLPPTLKLLNVLASGDVLAHLLEAMLERSGLLEVSEPNLCAGAALLAAALRGDPRGRGRAQERRAEVPVEPGDEGDLVCEREHAFLRRDTVGEVGARASARGGREEFDAANIGEEFEVHLALRWNGVERNETRRQQRGSEVRR